jgi:hypothetical protein
MPSYIQQAMRLGMDGISLFSTINLIAYGVSRQGLRAD